MALRNAAALAGALLLTFAALAALGEAINVFHLTAALLLAGVGMDYALFMSRSGDDTGEEAARALGSVITCMVTTLLTFGLLALCTTPVLHATGLTLCSFAVPCMCNSPDCINVSGLSELGLVSGRSCLCGGCRVARYCDRACQRSAWKRHKPVGAALAAAAAAGKGAGE